MLGPPFVSSDDPRRVPQARMRCGSRPPESAGYIRSKSWHNGMTLERTQPDRQANARSRIGQLAGVDGLDPGGPAAVNVIAAASPRMEALVFGPADFMASIRTRSPPQRGLRAVPGRLLPCLADHRGVRARHRRRGARSGHARRRDDRRSLARDGAGRRGQGPRCAHFGRDLGMCTAAPINSKWRSVVISGKIGR